MSTPDIAARALAFGLPVLLVLAQAVFMRAGYREPYPALLMPDFSGTRTATDGTIDVTTSEITVQFDDETAAEIPVRALLAPMPAMTTMAASEHGLHNPALSSGETVRWLRRRLATLHPERRAVSLTVCWRLDSYRVEEGAVRRVARVTKSTETIRLSP
jgi:hypothetical protein